MTIGCEPSSGHTWSGEQQSLISADPIYRMPLAAMVGLTALGARQFVTLIPLRTYGLELQYRF
jgi:hypothetical protein